MSLKRALGFSALESVGSRVFDFAILWMVLNSFSPGDIAKYGLATSSIFFFNVIFFAPEVALLRHQKKWMLKGELGNYISAFFVFSVFKFIIHVVLILTIYCVNKVVNWFMYAIVFSLITQLIQFSEISRIFFRMELQQKRVLRLELFNKLSLFVLCFWVVREGTLFLYFLVYFVWSVLVAIVWFNQLRVRVVLKFIGFKESAGRIWKSTLGFSFWSHMSGIITFYIYNSNILFLSFFEAPVSEIALYTVISKVCNLFFVIPMFFQSFVPIVLANSGEDSNKKFIKLLTGNVIMSLGQLLIFAVLGQQIGIFFGLTDNVSIKQFYNLGLAVSTGVFILNSARPLSTYLLMKERPSKVMKFVFIPSALFATITYLFGSFYWGILGCAVASSFAYIIMAMLLIIRFLNYHKSMSPKYRVMLGDVQ